MAELESAAPAAAAENEDTNNTVSLEEVVFGMESFHAIAQPGECARRNGEEMPDACAAGLVDNRGARVLV